MTRYRITAPELRFNGEFAGLVFRAGKADAVIPADQAAVTYCQRRGYGVTAVAEDGDPLPDGEQPDADTPDPDAVRAANIRDNGDNDEVQRPADYAPKGDWVAYAVSRGASEEDASKATKTELVAKYGSTDNERTNS